MAHQFPQIRLGSTLFVLAVSFVLGLPMLVHGPLIDGHDTDEHLNQTKHFSEQVWEGDLYPRWLRDMNTGLGSPTYFVYPPLPAYVCVLLEPMAKVLHFNAFNIAAWLPLMCSGIAALLWLRTLFSEIVAAVSAALYLAMPYHLAIDLYRRCAIPECWAFVWMPLILYFIGGAIVGHRRDSIGLAIAFALMIFSHLISVAMFFPIPIGIALVQSPIGQKVRSGVRIILAMALGTGISCIYLLPALANERYIPASRIIDVHTWSYNFVGFGPSLFVYSSRENFVQTLSWMVVGMLALVLICSIAGLKWAGRKSKTVVIFSIAICGVSTFMMSRLSSLLWRQIPGLSQAIEFPWRFNGLLCLGAVILIAVCLSSTPLDWRPLRTIFSVALFVVAATWVLAYGNVWRWYKYDTPRSRDENHLVNESDGWLPAWIPAGTSQRSSLIASFGPKVRFREGRGDARVLLWKARNIEFETYSATGGWVMINQFYYPAWKAELVDQAKPTLIRTALPEGLLEVEAPPGTQRIRVEIPVSFIEHLGRWISASCVFLCMILSLDRILAQRFCSPARARRVAWPGC